MGKKIIGLLGSPLPDGNTAKLLDHALKGAEDAGCEVEKIIVPFLEFEPCMEIFFCMEHETCQMEDDLTPMYDKFRNLDGLIIATPIMTMGIPGKLKSFMDRFQVFFMAKFMRKTSLVPDEKKNKREGLFISISGMNIPEVFDGAIMTVKAFFTIIDVKYQDELLIRDMDHLRDITKYPELLEKAYKKGFTLGKRIAES
jgi:multimeric flavodoxin WrbA